MLQSAVLQLGIDVQGHFQECLRQERELHRSKGFSDSEHYRSKEAKEGVDMLQRSRCDRYATHGATTDVV